MSATWTIKKVLDWAVEDFSNKEIESPRLEAELLLCHVLKHERIYLYTHFDRPLASFELASFKDAIFRRRQGECAAYIVGIKEFWSLDFIVNSAVLTPRPETETLVESFLDLDKKYEKILDLCTGTGCIAVAIASECANLQIDAVEICPHAANVARQNIAKHNLDNQITVLEGDLFDAIGSNKYDAIVTNPPYVIDSDIACLAKEVQKEPRLALCGGGNDGLDIIKRILSKAKDYLNPNGNLLIELDPRQADIVANSLGPQYLGKNGKIIKDLSSKDRVILFKL